MSRCLGGASPSGALLRYALQALADLKSQTKKASLGDTAIDLLGVFLILFLSALE